MTAARPSHALTDAGRVRRQNEDAVLELGEEQLWCVADGMGGHHDGAHASGLAVETLRRYRASPFRGLALARLEALVARCHDDLLRHARERGVDIVGCTLAVLSLHGRSALASWCGDARVYRVRAGRLLALTRDHSVGVDSDDRDLHVRPLPDEVARSALTTAIGGGHEPHFEHGWFALAPGDRFVLCTDGLNKELDETEILAHLDSERSTEETVVALFEHYRDRGARDNIGLIVVGPAAPSSTAIRSIPE